MGRVKKSSGGTTPSNDKEKPLSTRRISRQTVKNAKAEREIMKSDNKRKSSIVRDDQVLSKIKKQDVSTSKQRNNVSKTVDVISTDAETQPKTRVTSRSKVKKGTHEPEQIEPVKKPGKKAEQENTNIRCKTTVKANNQTHTKADLNIKKTKERDDKKLTKQSKSNEKRTIVKKEPEDQEVQSKTEDKSKTRKRPNIPNKDTSEDTTVNEPPVKKSKEAKVSKSEIKPKTTNGAQTKQNAKKPKRAHKTKSQKSPIKVEPTQSKDMKNSLDMDDIKGLLMRFEKKEGGDAEPEVEEMESGSDEDWEEVDNEGEDNVDHNTENKPMESVEITLEATSIMRKKRKKHRFDVEDWLRRQFNRDKKEIQANAHKVHLLSLLAHGFHRSALCSRPIVQATLLSIIPQSYLNLPKRSWGLVKLTQMTTWFTRLFPVYPDARLVSGSQEELLCDRIASKVAGSVEELVRLYVCLCRTVGLDARLVKSLYPMTYKATGLKAKPKDDEDINVGEVASTSAASVVSSASTSQTTKIQTKPLSSKNKSKKSKSVNVKSENAPSKSAKTDASKRESKYFDSKKSEKKVDSKMEKQTDRKEKTLSQKVTISRRRSSASKVEYCEESDESDGESKVKKKKKKKNVDEKERLSDSDEDFEEVETKFRSPTTSKKQSKAKKASKMVSSDSDTGEVQESAADINMWAEVYLEAENNWISVDCSRNSVNCREYMEEAATKPLSYVIAFQPGYVAKDLTQKYARNWLLETRKLRLDEAWWEQTMEPYKKRANKSRDRNEDLFIKAQLMKTPLPTSIGDFKSHPLYALQRHLLKFEAIYPPDAVPVGYIKGEPVYPRDCVHTLHSRETWLKDARMVRLKEEPYKYVKARPKKNQVNYNPEEKNLPIFGRWQTEDYIPPPAVDGKVPRNAYGNVELFKPSMLPGGTVHLDIPGLNKVARKLGIDCVAAMVGWEAHCGYSHPILQGFIVCEEFKDTLLAAWDEEQEIAREREIEKREKRVIDNWTRLTRGLLIRKRLKEKYDLTDPHGQNSPKKKAAKNSTASKSTDPASSTVSDMSRAWPMNRQAEKEQKQTANRKKKKEQAPLFPFEVETM